MEESSGFFEKVVEKSVEFAYSPKKRGARILFLLVAAGFLLRLVAALNLGVLADDMVFASQSAGIIGAKILSTHSNPPLFFYLTDLSYKTFGYTTFASRFWPLIAGALLIIVVFLITRKIFNENVALLAAFFVTFSSFLIRMTFSEHSLVVFFFSFLAIYFGLVYLESKKLYALIFSAVIFGLGFLTKYNAPFFILAFLMFSVFYLKSHKEAVFSGRNVKHLIIFLAIIFVLVLPILSFNYFIYKEKGIVDVYFSRVLKVEAAQELYQGLGGQERSFFDNMTIWTNYGNYKLLYKTDPALLLLSLIGLGLFFIRKKGRALSFFFIFLLIPFVLQSAGAPLQKHFAFMPLLFAIPAGYGLNWILGKFKGKIMKALLILFILVIMIVSLGNAHGTPFDYFSKSDTSQLKSFINGEVEENGLIVFDSRIYTAQTFWLATDHHFLILNQFPDFYNYERNLSNVERVPTTIYFVECIIDDCGWGWVANNQEFNQTSEQLLASLRGQAQIEKNIKSYNYEGNELVGEKEKTEKYKVYSLVTELNPSLVEQTDRINSFYYAPYLYKNLNEYVYNYEVSGFWGLLNQFSLWVIYFAVLIAIVSFFLVFRFL